MEDISKMKYNKYEIMLLIGLVLFTVENVLFWIFGLSCLIIGAYYVISHENEYMGEYEEFDIYEDFEEDTHLIENAKEQYIA